MEVAIFPPGWAGLDDLAAPTFTLSYVSRW